MDNAFKKMERNWTRVESQLRVFSWLCISNLTVILALIVLHLTYKKFLTLSPIQSQGESG